MTETLSTAGAERTRDVHVFPASFAQQRLWFLDRLEPGSSAYNIPLRARIEGDLDVRALEQALTEIIERHEGLRTSFFEEDGEPYQAIGAAWTASLPIDDFSSGPQPFDSVVDAAIEEANRPFDLARGPLLRTRLFRVADRDHVLALTLHHIVSDGWSMEVLLRELGELYTAAVEERTAGLPELALQYADFAVWQRDSLRGERLNQQVAYWREHLEGAPLFLALPTDRPRPALQTDRGAHERVTFGQPLVDEVQDLARRENVTLFMVLLAAFNALLSRYTGQQDVVVGTPIANRTRVELEGIIGSFANTLALRTKLDGDPTFQELLGRVREITLEAYSHQDLPFEKLVEELNPVRSLSHSPIFQVMLALQNVAQARLDLPGASLSAVPIDRGSSKFDLSIFASETQDGLRISCQYSTDLFDRSTITRLLGHFETILRAAVRAPELLVSELPLLTPTEQDELGDWNRTAASYERDRCLHDLVAERAVTSPHAPAVADDERELTYAELDASANRLAHHLRSIGVEPGSRVGLVCERSIDQMIGLLGILKSGAAYVPVEPAYPADRQAFMLEDAAVIAIVTHERYVERLPSMGAPVVCIDRDRAAIANQSSAAADFQASSEDLAYVIYTSGSTGRPKGVEIRHRSVVNLLTHMQQAPGLGPDDVVVNLTTPAFDLSVPDLYLPLITGAKLVIIPRESTLDADEIVDRLETTGATFMQATPTTWRMLVDAGWTGSSRLKIVCGGEALPTALVDELLSRGAELWHMYGPTETTVWSAIHRLRLAEGVPAIGGPIANTTFYVLDDRLQPVAVGIPGQLFIGGDGLARGYHNRTELTAEKFISNPFGTGRLYATGDLVRRREAGTLEFLGRIDTQVKLRGFRIELGEIEAVLEEHDAVAAAVAVVREDTPGDERLTAYVVAADALRPPSPGDLRAALAERLPHHMLPSAIVPLPDLPLTSNGKIDRRALPAPSAPSVREDEHVEPRDETERALAELWRRVLGLEHPVGITDDFFALGGHSLLAVRLFSEIERETGVKLPLAVLFQGANVKEIAVAVRGDLDQHEPWSAIVPLQPNGTKPPVFLLHGIDGELIFFRELVHHLGPDQPAYGLQPLGLDGKTMPHTHFEDMAAHIVGELRRFRPEGPYLLLGFCFSGILAYEVGHQLHQLGMPPALLAIIDAAPRQQRTRVEMERQKFADFKQRDLRGKLAWVRRRAGGVGYKVGWKARWLVFDALRLMHVAPPAWLWDVKLASQRAIRAYKTPPSPCRVTLFRAAATDQASYYRASFWTRLAEGGVETREIVADGIRHDNMLKEPFVAALAEEVTRAIANTQDMHSRVSAADRT